MTSPAIPPLHSVTETTNLVVARYRVESDAADFDKAAKSIAIGQTLGTADAAERPELQPYLATVLAVREVPPSESPTGKRYGLLDIGYPLGNVQNDIGTLLTVLFGKISMGGKIRLEDVYCPPALQSDRFPGPRFGIDGIREKVGVPDPDTPLLMSIFKPCLGLSTDTLGSMLYEQAVGGMNLVKDDEILSDPDLDSARRRLTACLNAADRAKQETGRTTLYAINLTGPAHEILDRARILTKEGATAFLFNYLSYGFPLLAALRSDPEINVPLMAHPSLAGAFYGSDAHGVSPQVIFGRLPRLAGADLVLFPSPYGSVSLPRAEAMRVKEALKQPMPPYVSSFPVPSAGIQEAMIPQILEDFGGNVVINAGTGIHDHPEGSRAGARAFQSTIISVKAGPVSQTR